MAVAPTYTRAELSPPPEKFEQWQIFFPQQKFIAEYLGNLTVLEKENG